jgi:hypothetical protein
MFYHGAIYLYIINVGIKMFSNLPPRIFRSLP